MVLLDNQSSLSLALSRVRIAINSDYVNKSLRVLLLLDEISIDCGYDAFSSIRWA
jgi:hypothetical protein